MVLTRSGQKPVPKASIISDRLVVQFPSQKGWKYLYRSSGVNSGRKNTWFPFGGIQKRDYSPKFSGTRKKGWFKKPNGYKIQNFFETNLPSSVSTKGIDRFGCIKDMILSEKIGGGWWETQEAEPFRKILQSLPDYNSSFSSEIAFIRSLD